MPLTDEQTTTHLIDALHYALRVIENYEMDIRDSAWTGVDLVAAGFCQGRIYQDATRDILRRARGDVPPDPADALHGVLGRAIFARLPWVTSREVL